MSTRRQGKYPDDYAIYPDGVRMIEYLRDGEIDARDDLVAAADKLTGIVVALLHPADFNAPSESECDSVLGAYEAAKAKVLRGHP